MVLSSICIRPQSIHWVRFPATLVGHFALPITRMLIRKTMTKKIHMKNLSITLAIFFHSAPLAHVALCSRKQLAMYSTLRTSLVSTFGNPLPKLQNTQGPMVTVGPWGGGFLSSGQHGHFWSSRWAGGFWSSMQQSLIVILLLELSYLPGADLERWPLSSLVMWCCTFTLCCWCCLEGWGRGYLWRCWSSWLPGPRGFPFAWMWELTCGWQKSSWR